MQTKQMAAMARRLRYVGTGLQYSMLTLALMNIGPSRAFADDDHSHTAVSEKELNSDQRRNASALLRIVRQSTERFKNVSVAESEGYTLQFGCVTGDYSAAMGLHFVNAALVSSGVLDVTRPQIVIYEPTPDGGRRLIGADYLLLADQWDANHAGPPELMGQLFHLFETPNRFKLPRFYTLHVWAWKDNPQGAFVNWHPNVSCEFFSGQDSGTHE